MRIEKRGVCTAELCFLNSAERTLCNYRTPYGTFLIGISTSDFRVTVTENCITAELIYAMDVGDAFLKDCEMKVEVRAREGMPDEIRMTRTKKTGAFAPAVFVLFSVKNAV